MTVFHFLNYITIRNDVAHTCGYKNCSQAGDSTDHHTDAQRPPTSDAVHRRPQYDVRRQLYGAGQEEVEELVTAQYRSVIRQPDVHARVCKPVSVNIT